MRPRMNQPGNNAHVVSWLVHTERADYSTDALGEMHAREYANDVRHRGRQQTPYAARTQRRPGHQGYARPRHAPQYPAISGTAQCRDHARATSTGAGAVRKQHIANKPHKTLLYWEQREWHTASTETDVSVTPT